ncbi:MAG: 16S rRNA (uracil(1498)-N(3))-methyltransferase [Candidatus Omnitrophica bacterium]|nr:16S rRNA (uracil(1498)-N(3))-methyltransferase [Candidatus Omnitrophota bacterium]
MPRFLVDQASIQNGFAALDPKESRHALSVLRLAPGEAVELLDGKGKKFSGFVSEIKSGRVFVKILNDSGKILETGVPICLAVSVLKPAAMDLLIQKAAELGAASIQPLLCERSVVKLSKERWAAKLARWQKIAAESCKQCGQTLVPAVHPARPFGDFTRNLGGEALVLFPTLAVKTQSLKSVLQNHPAKRVILFIGPEGDFTPGETKLALAKGAKAVSLGPLILRSETAAMFVLSALNFFYSPLKTGE